MSDEPSIEDILDSLDHLLKEGSEKNDDYSGDIHDETDDAGQPSESQEDNAQELTPPEVEPSDDSVKIGDSPASTPDETPELEYSATDMDDAPHPNRVMLSESMLVDNPQEHLPFDSGSSGTKQGTTPSEPDVGREIADMKPVQAHITGDVDVEKLLHNVSDELVSKLRERLSEELPGMIDEAVRKYVEGLKPED